MKTRLETSQSSNTTCLAERLNKRKGHLRYTTLIFLKGKDCCKRVSLVQCWQILASLMTPLALTEAAEY